MFLPDEVKKKGKKDIEKDFSNMANVCQTQICIQNAHVKLGQET